MEGNGSSGYEYLVEPRRWNSTLLRELLTESTITDTNKIHLPKVSQPDETIWLPSSFRKFCKIILSFLSERRFS